ncbi:MAG TPA: hypothetical protein VGN64_09400 [Dyadobacter sp.]|jgi:hypothetical protein|nr:hypothetical protein [Dyadobacter sp.]
MKALFYRLHLIFLILSCFAANGQSVPKSDTILFRNEAKLEVIVKEIQEHVLSYKKVNNPDGPVFTLNTSEIAEIHFGNGDIKVFDKKEEAYFEFDNSKTSKAATPFQNGQKFYNLPIKTVRTWQTAQLQTNYQFYLKKADTYKKMGTAGAIGGAAFTGIGIGIMSGASNSINSYNGFNQFLGGYMVFLAGVGAGIPLTIIGFVKHKSYNKKALLVGEELRKRREPLGYKITPILNPSIQMAGLSFKVDF